MPRPKAEVTRMIETIKTLTKEVKDLQTKVIQRDTLIKLMQEDHQRTIAVANTVKTKANAVVAQVEAFHQNWEQFKKAAIEPTFAENETDSKSFETQRKVVNSYQEVYYNQTKNN